MDKSTTTLLVELGDVAKAMEKAATKAANRAVEEALKLLQRKDWIREEEALEYLGASSKIALRRKAKEVGIITSNVGSGILYHQGSIESYVDSRSSDSISLKY